MSNISKYYPTIPSILEQFALDESLPKEEKAFSAWKALLQAKQHYEALFLAVGRLLKQIRDQRLFEALDYESFNQFINSQELGFSREKAFMVIRVYEYYIEHLGLSEESVSSMNVSRLSLMLPTLKKIEDKEEAIRQIQDMNSLRHTEFVREIKDKSSRDGKPVVYWSNELELWYVGYYDNTTHIHCLGSYEKTEVIDGSQTNQGT
jgi:hypothetical protein